MAIPPVRQIITIFDKFHQSRLLGQMSKRVLGQKYSYKREVGKIIQSAKRAVLG